MAVIVLMLIPYVRRPEPTTWWPDDEALEASPHAVRHRSSLSRARRPGGPVRFQRRQQVRLRWAGFTLEHWESCFSLHLRWRAGTVGRHPDQPPPGVHPVGDWQRPVMLIALALGRYCSGERDHQRSCSFRCHTRGGHGLVDPGVVPRDRTELGLPHAADLPHRLHHQLRGADGESVIQGLTATRGGGDGPYATE